MRKKLATIISCVMLLVLTACGSSQDGAVGSGQPAQENDQTDGVLRQLTLAYNTSDGIDPLYTTTDENKMLVPLCYEPLFELDNHYQPQPVLCESIEKTGTREYTITIRNDVTFHSGEKLTASDVVSSLNRARKNDNSVYAEQLSGISSVKSRDGDVVIRLYQDNAQLASLLTVPIDRELEDSDIPDGTGAFQLIDDGGSYHLQKNENWHGSSISYCDSIALVSVTDTTDAENQFSSGEVSLLMRDDPEKNSVQSARYVYNTAGTRLHFLGINCDTEPYDTAKVRKALSMLLDRESVISVCMSERADAAALPMQNAPEDAAAASYDQEEALKLLKSANIEDIDDDGMLELDNGQDFVIDIIYNQNYPTKGAVLEQYVQTLEKAGIQTNIQGLDYEDCQKKLRREAFELYYGELDMQTDFDISSLITSDGNRNFSGYYNKKLQRSLTAMRSAEDEAEYNDAVKAFAERFTDESPIIPIAFERNMVYAAAQMPDGFDPWPTNVFHGMENWK